MQSALLLIIFIFLYIGLLYPTLAIVCYDIYSKPNKTLSTIIRWRKREHDIWQTTTLYNILQIVAPLIPLSESSEKKMNEDLARADIPFNAKEYYAKAILSSIGGILVALIGSSMNSTLIVVGGILLCIYLFFKNYVAQNLHKETKLNARLMNWTLVLICIVIGLFLSITLFQELGKPEKKQTIRLPETNGLFAPNT